MPGRNTHEPLVVAMTRPCPAEASTLQAWRAAAHDAPPMLAPEFALLTARLMREREWLLVGARAGETLVSALPLVRRGRTLLALRSDHTPRVDAVGDADALPAVWRAILGARGWDVLELRGVPEDSPLARVLPEMAVDDGCRVTVREVSRAPWFAIEGIEQRIHRRFRGDMRRLERQLGGVELERIERFDRAAMRDVVRLEAAAWKGAAGSAIGCDADLVRFYTALTRVFAARGHASIAFLRARGRRIAAQLAMEDATTYYLLKVGYDPEFAHFGPGQLLVRETAADAARRGLSVYDLMGKDTPWKTKWTEQARPHVEVRVYRSSVGGRTRHFVREVVRPLAGRALRTARGGTAASD